MIPAFAVVGHPNKGKSSIVATIVRDDSIAIDAQSGTTRTTTLYPVRVGDREFQLADTPGFQRADQALAWLQAHCSKADQRGATVRLFVSDSDCRRRFPDEVELLGPIVDGAAILYVVDGSRPYGPEYEHEMEILRWTGQVSMALINPIENSSHVAEWQQALSQYFKAVRVFNPMQADYAEIRRILLVFAHLREDWREQLLAVVTNYRLLQEKQQAQCVRELALLLWDLCHHSVVRDFARKQDAEQGRRSLELRYQEWMQQREVQSLQRLKEIYQYRHLQSMLDRFPLDNPLTDTSQWLLWGLSEKRLMWLSAMTGAALGGVIGGISAAIAAVPAAAVGALAGAATVLAGSQLIKWKLIPIEGGYRLQVGPVRDMNFPFVVLGRFLSLYQVLRNRTHARREQVVVQQLDSEQQLALLPSVARRELEGLLLDLVRQRRIDELRLQELLKLLLPVQE
jgi:GTPase Era involved in 16S rRNA processing